jgi:hypothetical protein
MKKRKALSEGKIEQKSKENEKFCRWSGLEVATISVDLCHRSGLVVATVSAEFCHRSGLEVATVSVDFGS